MRKKISFIMAFVMLFIMATPPMTIKAAAPEGWRQLSNLEVFKDKVPDGWCGSGSNELETVNDMLPLDTSETYNGLPSLKFNIQKNVGTWTTAQLAIRGWCAEDLSQYLPNGYIEFNVKGKEGGEQFRIGAKDIVHERLDASSNPIENVEILKQSSDYFTISKEWQHVKIPLKDIVDATKGFSVKAAQAILLKNDTVTPITAWINDLKITSTDNEKGYAPIKVNQVGYLTNSEKYALVTGFQDEFKAVEGTEFKVNNALDNSVVYTGKLTLVKDYDSTDSGERVLKADFSSVTTPGSYYITVSADGVEKSVNFKIGNDVFSSLLTDATRYFYYQRQGIELTSPSAISYPRKDVTPQDSQATLASDPTNVRDVSKGWHDAGDKGKYVLNGALAVSDMFWSYEMFPSVFKDNQFNIPESGNGVVDILDEARWEVEWILKMQDSVSGGFYARVQSDTAPTEQVVNSRIIKDQSGNVTNIKSTDDTACAAAILAHAYITYKDIDKNFADQCLAAAKNAWSFLEKNPTTIVSPSGPYNVYDDSSDRLWGAASLFRATGEDIYGLYFKNNYKKFAANFENPNAYGHNWGNMWTTAFWTYLKADKKDSDVQSWIKTEFSVWLNNVTKRYKDSTWQNTITKVNVNGESQTNYFWGCNSDIMMVSNDAIIGSKLLGTYDESIAKFSNSSLNWILGINPQHKSYVSGYGEDCIQTTFSYLYSYDNRAGIPKGYLAGGPNVSEGKGISKFSGKCYIDSDQDWVSNENCLNWNAPLIFATAFANNEAVPAPIPKATVNYTVAGDWGTGATINVTIKNNTSSDIKGWNLNWTFPGNQSITNIWNGSYTQNGSNEAVKNLDWNATIPANGSITIGLNISYSGTDSKPTSFTLNNEACYLDTK